MAEGRIWPFFRWPPAPYRLTETIDFEEAEALLKGVEELGHRPWEEDRREEARIALGDLYLQWDQPEEAAAAYERALELNPGSERAKEKLKELRQER